IAGGLDEHIVTISGGETAAGDGVAADIRVRGGAGREAERASGGRSERAASDETADRPAERWVGGPIGPVGRVGGVGQRRRTDRQDAVDVAARRNRVVRIV